MTTAKIIVRPVHAQDRAAWDVLWEGYNAFYGRSGATALAAHITEATWANFFDAAVPVQCHVAEVNGIVQGLVHMVFHHSTSREGQVCYLQDLFVTPAARGRGLARALIESVYTSAQAAACSRVYWQTQESNHTARALYDQMADFKGFIVYSKELAR
jgi:ribosomal protein S18 acetylase RimI-like enzyme